MALNDTFQYRDDEDTDTGWGYDEDTDNSTGEKGGIAERTPEVDTPTTDMGYEEEDYEDDVI